MEIRDIRCCMCPQINSDNCICPIGPGKSEETPCDFVVVWVDGRGWKYKVMIGIGKSSYKGRYQDDKNKEWKCMRQMEWRDTFDKAQEDLNCYAKRKGWHPEILNVQQEIGILEKLSKS